MCWERKFASRNSLKEASVDAYSTRDPLDIFAFCGCHCSAWNPLAFNSPTGALASSLVESIGTAENWSALAHPSRGMGPNAGSTSPVVGYRIARSKGYVIGLVR
jgi:hypothetical protein